MCCLALAVDQTLRHGVRGVAAWVLVAAAWMVGTDHIFSPMGAIAMALLGLTTALLFLLNWSDGESVHGEARVVT